METDKRCTLHPTEDVILELTPTLKHHGRFNCAHCGKFVVWAKQPKTTEDMIGRQQLIASILRDNLAIHLPSENNKSEPYLPDSDLHLLLKLYSVAHLTLVQESHFRRLTEKYVNA